MRDSSETEVVTFSKEFQSASNFTVEAKTTGLQGGDAGHGGFLDVSFFPMEDFSSEFYFTEDGVTKVGENQGITFRARGDCEMRQLVDGLEFLAKKLRGKFPIK